MPFGLPPADTLHPVTLPDGTPYKGTVNLNVAIDHPRIEVGDHTYASDFDPPEDWASRLAPYLFPFSQEMLRIGKFCQIAQGVRFIGASANHETRGASTFPFVVFNSDTLLGYQPDTRDITIGHDVWLAFGVMVLSGAKIGNGVIVGAGAVVRGTVPDYSVVTGNPAQVVRRRFSDDDIDLMNTIAWWNWPREVISEAHQLIEKGSPTQLRDFAIDRGLFCA